MSANHAYCPALLISCERFATAQDPFPLSAAGFHAEFNREILGTIFHAVLVNLQGSFQVVWMDQVLPGMDLSFELVEFKTQHASIARAVVYRSSLYIPIP